VIDGEQFNFTSPPLLTKKVSSSTTLIHSVIILIINQLRTNLYTHTS